MRNLEGLSRQVIKIVVSVVLDCFIVVFAKIPDPFWFGDGVIISGDVVRDYVDDHLEPLFMRPLNQGMKLLQSFCRIDCQVGIHVVIILDGIGRARPTLDHVGIVVGDAVSSIVMDHIVVEDSCEPDVGDTQFADLLQCFWGKIPKFAHSVFLDCSPWFVGGIGIAKQPGKNLVNHNFMGGTVIFYQAFLADWIINKCKQTKCGEN